MYNLYLDDERSPKTNRDWVVVRSYQEATEYVEVNGMPAYISFDHDLGVGNNGYDFAKWLGDRIVHSNEPMFEWNVHSANPTGANNIRKYLEFVTEYNERKS